MYYPKALLGVFHELNAPINLEVYSFKKEEEEETFTILFSPSYDSDENKIYVSYYVDPDKHFTSVYTIYVDNPEVLLLSRLTVPEKDRGKGYGNQGLLFACKILIGCISMDFKELRLQVLPDKWMKGWYERRGFRKIGQEPRCPKLDLMTLELESLIAKTKQS